MGKTKFDVKNQTSAIRNEIPELTDYLDRIDAAATRGDMKTVQAQARELETLLEEWACNAHALVKLHD